MMQAPLLLVNALTPVMLAALISPVSAQQSVSKHEANLPARPNNAPETVIAEGPEIQDPVQLKAANGILNVTLEAAPSRITLAGESFLSNVFNGAYIPPTLVLAPGDRLNLTLINNISRSDNQITNPQPSNLHYHGMVIPPREPADDIYLVVPSGNTITGAPDNHAPANGLNMRGMDMQPSASPYRTGNKYHYSWVVPQEHATGINWYHPHIHGHVEDQILSGLSGMLMIDGFLETHYPELSAVKRRQLLFKDINLPSSPDGSPKTKTINGVLGGIVRMRPGELQFWQLANVGADSFVDFAVDGHKFWVLERDGNALAKPEEVTSVYLPPSSRAAVVVSSGNRGTYGIRTLDVDNGPAGDPNPERILGALIVEGTPIDNGDLSARLLLAARDGATLAGTARHVQTLPVTRKRTIRYSESADGNTFFIDGKEFDMSRDDVTVTLGDVEEWTIVNDTDERHSFHIHQLDFLVTGINGDDEDAEGLRDVIDIPYRVNGKPGSVTLIIPFRNPLMVGRFPFHCHIAEHEDKGMMANVRVRAKAPN